jgi:hypothetical protein
MAQRLAEGWIRGCLIAVIIEVEVARLIGEHDPLRVADVEQVQDEPSRHPTQGAATEIVREPQIQIPYRRRPTSRPPRDQVDLSEDDATSAKLAERRT